MVLRGPPSVEHDLDLSASGLQPSGLGSSAFFLGAQIAAGVHAHSKRGGSRVGRELFKPVAEASSPSGNSTPGSSGASTNGGASSSSKSGFPGVPSSLHLPRPSGRAVWMGIGAGGVIYGGTAGRAMALWPFSRAPAAGKDNKPRAKRVLIMMSNTGGGHKASAEALRDAFKEKYGDKYEVSIVDMWKEHTPAPFNTMPDAYSFMVKHSILWRLSYEITQPKAFHVPYLAFVGMFMRRGLNRAFDKYQPDLVVSVHPLMQHVPIGVLRQRIKTGRMSPINFATVVTDFTTCHNTWFHTGTTRCFVPTTFCASLARHNGLDDGQIITHGLPIRPVFSKPVPGRKVLRRQLGLAAHTPAILLVGGGEGMGALEATVKELDAALGADAQVAVICGRNKKLLAKLQGSQPPNGLKVVPVGFVDNMHEWMATSDVIITKAGPGTVAEALICGLPILLNGNIPCQEEGNIPYVIDNEVGDFETDPPKIAHIMRRWLGHDPHHPDPHRHELSHMSARSKELGRPDAVYQIVHDLAGLADKPDFEWGPAQFALSRNGKRRAGGNGGAPAAVPA